MQLDEESPREANGVDTSHNGDGEGQEAHRGNAAAFRDGGYGRSGEAQGHGNVAGQARAGGPGQGLHVVRERPALAPRFSKASDAGSQAEQAGRGCGGGSQFSAVTLLVRGLPFNATEGDLRRFFAREQITIGKATICYDQETWRCKGYGFADLPSHEKARYAVQALNGVEVGGALINVEIKEPARPSDTKTPARASEESHDSGGGGKAAWGWAESTWAGAGKGQGYAMRGMMGKGGYGNGAEWWSQQSWGGWSGDDGGCTGQRKGEAGSYNAQGRGDGYGQSRSQGAAGGSDQGVNQALRIFVGGVSYNCTEEQLREKFSEAGEVVFCKIGTDKDTGKPKGFAFVEYATKREVDRAMRTLQGAEVCGKTVRLGLPNGTGLAKGDQRDDPKSDQKAEGKAEGKGEGKGEGRGKGEGGLKGRFKGISEDRRKALFGDLDKSSSPSRPRTSKQQPKKRPRSPS